MPTNPCTKAMQDSAKMIAGFRPIESNKDPNAGEIIISVNAAHAAIVDRVDVARSDPISAMRAGAGEKATKVEDKVKKKDDDRKTIKSLRLQDADADADDGDDVRSFLLFVAFNSFPFSLRFVLADRSNSVRRIVDPPLRKIDAVVCLFFNCER